MDSADTGAMIVKRVSVPIGLEELMEGLVKEVLLKKPDDIYFFAAKYFSQLLLVRDKGQTKVKTVRSAQSLTDQREKRVQTKIPVSGVTKQLSRQFSVRGESPMRNFDSPIVSQKPKMFDRNESKYKRRNTGPPTIPENHMNIAVRKKYSRSVSTERKRETGNSIGGTRKSINRKETREMQDETNEKSARNKNGDKRNSVTKLQKNFNLMKNIPTDQAVKKISGQKNISEKNETDTNSKSSVTETAESNCSVKSNNDIQQVSNQNSPAPTELLVHDDSSLLSEKTATSAGNGNVEKSRGESEDGNNISKKNVVEVDNGIKNDSSADGSIHKNDNGIEGIMKRNDDDKQRKNEPIDDDEKPQTMEQLADVNVGKSDELLKVDSKIDKSSEKSISPSDTLDNLTMGSENVGMSNNKESRSVYVNSYENDIDITKNSESTSASKLAYINSNEVNEVGHREQVAEAATNVSDRTKGLLGDGGKAMDNEILSEKETENKDKVKDKDKDITSFQRNTIEEMNGILKTDSKSEQSLLEIIPTKHIETSGTENYPEPSNEKGISDETNVESSHRNELNESNRKTEQRVDPDNQQVGEDNQPENNIEKKVIDIDSSVIKKENINDEWHGGVNNSQDITGDDVQGKTKTETLLKQDIISSEISLQNNSIVEHGSHGDTAYKDASHEGKDSEGRVVNEVSEKATYHSLSENVIIRTTSSNGVDMKHGDKGNHKDIIINEKTSSTDNFKHESIESLEEPLKTLSLEHERDAMDDKTSVIITGQNSSERNNKVGKKEHEPNDQQLTGQQRDIEGVPKETPDSLPEKELDVIMTNEAVHVSETDEALKKTPSRLESNGIAHDRIDKAENESILKTAPVGSEKLTNDLAENNTTNKVAKDISHTNSTDEESFSNAGNESIPRNESAENEGVIIKDSSRDHETVDSQKTPYIDVNQSYKNPNDKSILPKSSDNLGDEQIGYKTAKIISNITENSKLKTDDKKSHNAENKVESSGKTEKLPRDMSDDIERGGKKASDTQKLKENQDEPSTCSAELKTIVPETTEQNETKSDLKHPLHNDSDSNEVSEKKNVLFENTSKQTEMGEIHENSLMHNLKGKQEELPRDKNLKNTVSEKSDQNETTTDRGDLIRNDIKPSQVTENTVIYKEMRKLNTSDTVANEEKEKFDEDESVSATDQKASDSNGFGSDDETNKKGDMAHSKTIDEHEHISTIDSSHGPEDLKLENSKLEQVLDRDEDVANILNDQSNRNKRTFEQDFSKNTQDSDSKSNLKGEHEYSSDFKGIEDISNIEKDSGDPKSNHENRENDAKPQGGVDLGRNLINYISHQPGNGPDSKVVSDIIAGDEKPVGIDTAENKTNVGIIDKVAKNYISYVIDRENYLKYNHADDDRKEDDTHNITNSISHGRPKNPSEAQNKFDENSDIQKSNTKTQTSFDRLKLSEELGIPSMKEPNDSEREQLKRNISSTLSIAETGLIDTHVKTFINNFINNEKDKQLGKEEENANKEEYKVTPSTKVESEEIIGGSEDNKKDSNPNGSQPNESFDRSKLREELQKIEQESKLTSFKQSFNPSLLRQELEHAALLKKSTKTNEYSSTLAKGAAVVRIQSMWRGFIVRRSFPKPQHDGKISVHRDENSNVYQKKSQEPLESKLNTSYIENKMNNEDPKLMEAVATIQRCWRGFKVRKHLNRIRMKQDSLGSARIKRHVDDKNIDYFDTMMAAVKIQKIWRGFITRKKLNITKKTGQKRENEKDGDETNGELTKIQKPLLNNENTQSTESHESISRSDDGVKQIVNDMPIIKNGNNGNDEGLKSVPGRESNLLEKITIADNSKKSNYSDQKTNEDDKKIINHATKIQSVWRGFLVRKYIKQLKKQMENKRDGVTYITDHGNFPKDELQRPTSIDSNDSSNTVIFNDINKKSEEGSKPHDEHLLGYHRDFDDVDASLDEILEYPLIKDEHLIDDYQNELLDRISGKQKDSGNDTDKMVEPVSSKRIEEIKAEDSKGISTLHTSLLSNSVGQDRNESQIEQIHPRKLESVIEESPSHTAEDPMDSKTAQADGATTTSTTEKEGFGSEIEGSKHSFCSELSAPPRETKVTDGKPLSDFVEEIDTKQKSPSSSGDIGIGRNGMDQHTMQENVDEEFGSDSAENAQSSSLKNVKLYHSGEWHDSIVVPLPKGFTESLKTDTQKGRIGHSRESEKSVDSTADLSSILSNSSAGLLHTGEMHDVIVVPISLASLGRTISSSADIDEIDTVDSHTQAAQNPEVQTSSDTTDNGASSIGVRVLQAPEPQVLTSPMPITDARDVTRADEGRTAQTPNKEDLRIQSQLSPPVSQSMESEAAGKTEEKNMEAQAATKIQAGFRGYQVRKQLKLKNGSSDMNPPKRQCRGKCQGRSDSAKSQTNRPKDVEEKSAVKIQAGVRGFLVRRRQKKQSNQES